MRGQEKRQAEPARETYRTLQDWALGILLGTLAIEECEYHSQMRDLTDPDAWRRAREIASQHPFKGATAAEAVRAIEDVMASIGDTCPTAND
jgi:hypothetical protein